MAEKEVVFVGNNRLKIKPEKFVEERLSLDQYEERFLERPSIAFDAFQRAYAALRMFGREEPKKPGKPARWNFLNDLVDKPNKKLGVGALYGVEDLANSIMSYLNIACVSPDMRSRFILLYGPPSSAKTNLIELIADCLDAFTTLPEGAVYTVRWDLQEIEGFGGLSELVCPAHEYPLNFMRGERLEKILEKVNVDKEEWQQIKPNTTNCPVCAYIIRTLRKLKINPEERLKVVRLFPTIDITKFEFRPTAEKAYDPQQIFGGATNFERLSRFGNKDHPLVFNFGIGGTIDGPSPQHHLVHFSEMYKGGEEFLNEMLDLIQSKTLVIKGKYEVPVDALFISTTNLEEFEKMKSLPRLGEYLTSRSYSLPGSYLLTLDDMATALRKRIFEEKRLYHIAPHFIENVLSAISVLAALDDPPSDLKITLEQKAKVYNGEMPHGLEYNIDELYQELWADAHNKPSSAVTEGIRRGIPFRFFQELPVMLAEALDKVPRKIKEEYADPGYPQGCIVIVHPSVKALLEGMIKRYDGISEDTRSRIVQEILSKAWDSFEEEMTKDVNKAILGEERIVNLATRYLAQVYEIDRGRREYLDLRGQKQRIDGDFLKDLEKGLGVANPSEFRKAMANNVKYRRSDFMITSGGEKRFDMTKLSRQLIGENSTFRRAVEDYSIKHILPSVVDDVSLVYSEINEPLINNLRKEGYCKACAMTAISAAVRRRVTKEKK